jgi:hypothetical protein
MGLNGFSRFKYRIVKESEKQITADIYLIGSDGTFSRKWGAKAKESPNLWRFVLFSNTYTGRDILNIDFPLKIFEPILPNIYLKTFF